MRKTMKKTFTMALVAATVAMNATASDKGLYFKADLGAALPTKFGSVDYGSKKADNSVVFGVGLGKELGHGFSADLSFYRFDKFKFSHTLASAGNGKVTQDISSNLLTLNANYALPKYKVLIPFVTAGFGVVSNESGDRKTTMPNGNIRTVFSKTQYDYAWNIGVGTQIETGTPVDLTLSYKYFDLGEAKTQGLVSTTSPAGVSGVPASKTNLKAHSIMAGMKYKF
jgi:opacity protein-like surface antigen